MYGSTTAPKLGTSPPPKPRYSRGRTSTLPKDGWGASPVASSALVVCVVGR